MKNIPMVNMPWSTKMQVKRSKNKNYYAIKKQKQEELIQKIYDKAAFYEKLRDMPIKMDEYIDV